MSISVSFPFADCLEDQTCLKLAAMLVSLWWYSASDHHLLWQRDTYQSGYLVLNWQGGLVRVWGWEKGHWWVVVGILMLNSKGILVKGGLVRVWGWEQGHWWVVGGDHHKASWLPDTDAELKGYPCQGWHGLLYYAGYSDVWYWCWTVSSLVTQLWFWCWTVTSLVTQLWYWCWTVTSLVTQLCDTELSEVWLLSCVMLMLNCHKSGYSTVWYWTVRSLVTHLCDAELSEVWLLICVILMLNCQKSGYSAVWYWCWTVRSLVTHLCDTDAELSEVWLLICVILMLNCQKSGYSSVWYWCCTVALWLTGWPGQGGGGGLSQVCSAVWPAGTSPWHLLLHWCRTGQQAGFGKWLVSETLQLITRSLSLQMKCAVVLLGASGRSMVTRVMQAKLYWNLYLKQKFLERTCQSQIKVF